MIPIPLGLQLAAGALTAGAIIPLSLTVAAVTLVPGAGTLALTVTGTLVVQQAYFFTITHAFALTVTLAVTPSGDPTNASRVVAVMVAPPPAAAPTLTATGIPGFVTAPLAPAIAVIVSSLVETRVNAIIMGTAPGALAGSGFMLTPTARISAVGITITTSGISLRPVLGDFFGPGVVPIPGTLSISISPTPEAGVQHSYLVTVTNSANGAAVAGATVVLHNYTTLNPQTIVSTTKTTDAQGHATFTTTLHFKKQRIVHGANDFEIILISPTLTVSHSGFSPVEIVLLEDLN